MIVGDPLQALGVVAPVSMHDEVVEGFCVAVGVAHAGLGASGDHAGGEGVAVPAIDLDREPSLPRESTEDLRQCCGEVLASPRRPAGRRRGRALSRLRSASSSDWPSSVRT